jgi:tRNA U34 2-thiouridine synthase MnmA/TrmU
MFRLAGEVMKKEHFDFLFSGEVLGQRPMSQTKPSLRYVEKHSGCDGYIVRPLSAKLLPPTIPEQQGLLNREDLLDISGRGRKRQIALAEAFGITDNPAPAGGCLLTDPGFCRRLKDLFDHQTDYQERDVELLKYGRHFRIDENHKVIVGRAKEDNSHILRLMNSRKDTTLHIRDIPSPVTVIPYSGPDETVQQAARLCAAYSKAKQEETVHVHVLSPHRSEVLTVSAPPREAFQPYVI